MHVLIHITLFYLKKRDAYLPRLPRNKIKRPTFVRGRLLKDPGGTDAVDRFVQVAEGFQKCKRVNVSFIMHL